MVAYSFQPRFVGPIEARTKRQTIRKPRIHPSRHVQTGKTIQLYTGLRTKHCKLIGHAMAERVRRIILDLGSDKLWLPDRLDYIDDLDAFAVRDGFRRWDDLKAFWHKHHPGVSQFDGVLIEWGNTFDPAAVG